MGKVPYHPLVHGEWYKREQFPSNKAWKIFRSHMKAEKAPSNHAEWKKREQIKKYGKNPKQKIKFKTRKEYYDFVRKQLANEAKLSAFQLAERDRKRLFAMKSHKLGFKFIQWKKNGDAT